MAHFLKNMKIFETTWDNFQSLVFTFLNLGDFSWKMKSVVQKVTFLYQWVIRSLFFIYFRSFPTDLYRIIKITPPDSTSGIWTQIVGIEGQHVNHQDLEIGFLVLICTIRAKSFQILITFIWLLNRISFFSITSQHEHSGKFEKMMYNISDWFTIN